MAANRLTSIGCALAALTTLGISNEASAQEPASCLSPDPAAWPKSSKPYFMLAVDTSGSMIGAIGSANSCGYPTNNRITHARCAVRNAVLAYSGQVNFGLTSFAWRNSCTAAQAACPGSGTCAAQYPPGNNNFCGPFLLEPTLGVNVHAGGHQIIPMLQDHYWLNPPDPTNVPNIIQMVDNVCGIGNGVNNGGADGYNSELGANSNTPIGGILFDMNRYFSNAYTDKWSNALVPTPIGTVAQGERPCRSINVLLITDGDETCDATVSPTPIPGGCRSGFPSYLNNSGERLASYEADRLFTTGVTFGGQNFKVRTHVINFAGGDVIASNNIAACGGTGTSYFATNEAQLATALSNIIASSVAPEVCNNVDDNCNGCTDEGYTHYCNTGQTCCAWANQAQRTTCINNYTATITPADPDGDLTLLPCTTPMQQTQPANWLCFDPKETCDNVDNNCQGGVDENVLKCGNPPHCPLPESCLNSEDDDCDGQINEGCGGCIPSAEICDGCDNDCDGFTDNGIPPIPCGLMSPPNCAGQLTCKAPVAVPIGTCAPGGGYNNCSNNPQMEVCDMIDNDCDGLIDDGLAPVPCVPPNTPPNLVYGGTSQCQMGLQPCGGSCQGFIGPSAEICDGIDNDCDGVVDDGVPGVGLQCGINQPPCTPGLTACVNGALVCQGGTGPQAEICDGIDNNCNGQVDEAPLADAPAQGMNGCWDLPGNCCTFPNQGPAADLTWCPPPNASCNDNGSLQAPCNKGTLACAGASGWICQNAKGPAPEACDGLDNDCNGLVDDGNIPQVGQPCGSDVGECVPGVLACNAGVLDCVGDTPPIQELCNGLDDDCDGVIDNGIPTGGSCTPPYDMMAYPDTIGVPPCAPGVLQCDGNGGLICVGGQGPTPEVCDGIDNDCDGSVDETGMPPNGIDGTQNPFPPPDAAIGDACGVDTGECKEGAYACLNGVFACIGSQGPAPEECDCSDNDCDGTVDNPNPNEMPPLCARGKDCINSSVGCQCAEACSGEFGCPPGFKCEQVTDSSTGQNAGNYCVKDACGDCSVKTVKDGNDQVLCAPDGTPPDSNCISPPICQCKGQNGCKEPCDSVLCDPGSVCTSYGPKAGTCVVDKCFDVKCQGCDVVCSDTGDCIPDPCEPNPCAADEACKPSADFMTAECFKSCADVMCPSGQKCTSGQCEDTCDPPCPDGDVCDEATDQCVDSLCANAFCADGSCCDGLTGECHVCACDTITCPEGQVCADGQCVQGGTGGAGGGGGQGSSTGGDGSGGDATSGPGAGNGGAAGKRGIWGLTTGGGGCQCDAAGSDGGNGRDASWAFVALAAAVALRRRPRTRREEVQ